jgi:hypothetical protein
VEVAGALPGAVPVGAVPTGAAALVCFACGSALGATPCFLLHPQEKNNERIRINAIRFIEILSSQ